ncbi:Big-1 (bacterial Ig-like domain 1) domain containing protein [Trema orientale]|uniref:Big-1 (Bacterial Ig-like domain 1) domain containing protein n=1 Tax=Trema orientale TaxID=63057 RepID=A0A2P5ETM2_TREOI|nr:Big-1 (bacterial Ig-like domain 1) domain containing protein [Trema orientale]
MAYHNSLLLFAFFLIATTSVVNSQIVLPGTVIVGLLNNVTSPGLNLGITPLAGVNVSLSCNGGRTTVGPVVTTNGNGVFTITLPPSITVNPLNCIVVANATSLINSTTSFAGTILGSTLSFVAGTLGFTNAILLAAGGFVRTLV